MGFDASRVPGDPRPPDVRPSLGILLRMLGVPMTFALGSFSPAPCLVVRHAAS